jgi:hypothetical protein
MLECRVRGLIGVDRNAHGRLTVNAPADEVLAAIARNRLESVVAPSGRAQKLASSTRHDVNLARGDAARNEAAGRYGPA